MHCSRCHACYQNDPSFDFFVFRIRTLSRQGRETKLGCNKLQIAGIALKKWFLCSNGGHSRLDASWRGRRNNV
ncbi:unnamed protein product [Cylicocyclus nassatus]|uniref:Uncharacterized protein n=1 Tax=Cylicocyclus nassatus TaxID=53992 RepID=A0AA36DQH6_CYLNA|nr:unnamed protein product [Cylicocyclus nassatus]